MTERNDNQGVEAAQERTLYSVIRYVPSILREEFVNVGVVVVAPGSQWHGLKAVSSFGEESRVQALPGSDGAFVRHAIHALSEMLSRQSKEKWSEERFVDFTIAYSANNLQLSPPRPIASEDAQTMLSWLFTEMVEDVKVEKKTEVRGRTALRREVKSVFTHWGLFKLGLKEDVTLPVRSEPVVDMAYQNGVWHCYQALPFDIKRAEVSRQVNAFRQTVADARLSDTQELAEGKFLAFTTPFWQATDSELMIDLTGLMHDARIDVMEANRAEEVAPQIYEHLHAHDLLKQRPQG